MKISIVLPIYNEEKRINNVLKDLSLNKLPIVIVDDGSNDKSNEKINNLKNKNTTILTHKINLGKGAALKTGCEYAFSHGADAIVMMDSDGQHKVADLNKFVEKLQTNKYDVIFGSRNLNVSAPIDRFLGNKIASVIVNIMFGIYVSDLICGYRAFTLKGYKKIKWQSIGYGVETEMVIRTKKAKLIYCEVPVETIYYDNYKGVSILDAFQVLANLFYWKLTI